VSGFFWGFVLLSEKRIVKKRPFDMKCKCLFLEYNILIEAICQMFEQNLTINILDK